MARRFAEDGLRVHPAVQSPAEVDCWGTGFGCVEFGLIKIN